MKQEWESRRLRNGTAPKTGGFCNSVPGRPSGRFAKSRDRSRASGRTPKERAPFAEPMPTGTNGFASTSGRLRRGPANLWTLYARRKAGSPASDAPKNREFNLGSKRTATLELAKPPRPSSTFAEIMYDPRGGPVESQQTWGPGPSTMPPVDDHVCAKGTLSGSAWRTPFRVFFSRRQRTHGRSHSSTSTPKNWFSLFGGVTSLPIMANKLIRHYGRGHPHFIAFTSHRRLPLLRSTRAGDAFVHMLGEVRGRFRCHVQPIPIRARYFHAA